MSTTASASDVPRCSASPWKLAIWSRAPRFTRRCSTLSGQRHPGARHYFVCGGVILAVLDPTQGGLTPTPGPKSLYFSVRDLIAVHQRATQLNALAPYEVHGEPPPPYSSVRGASDRFTSLIRGATICASSRTAPCIRSDPRRWLVVCHAEVRPVESNIPLRGAPHEPAQIRTPSAPPTPLLTICLSS